MIYVYIFHDLFRPATYHINKWNSQYKLRPHYVNWGIKEPIVHGVYSLFMMK